jgi:hypothetical protein
MSDLEQLLNPKLNIWKNFETKKYQREFESSKEIIG